MKCPVYSNNFIISMTMAAVKGGHGGCRLCDKLLCSRGGPGVLLHLHVCSYAAMCHHKWTQDKAVPKITEPSC